MGVCFCPDIYCQNKSASAAPEIEHICPEGFKMEYICPEGFPEFLHFTLYGVCYPPFPSVKCIVLALGMKCAV